MKKLRNVLITLLIACMVVPVFKPVVVHASVRISNTKKTMYAGDTYVLKVYGTNKKVKWSSSDKNVATVNQRGNVKAKEEGKTTITAKAGKKKYKCKVFVKRKKVDVSYIEIEKTDISIEKGETYNIRAYTYPEETSETKISWKTSDDTVVEVDSNGKIKAKRLGKAKITATAGGKSAECNVFVYENINKDIYKDRNVSIKLERISVSDYPDEYQFRFEIENTSGRDICVQTRDTSVNGYMADPIFSADISSGKKIRDELCLLISDVDGEDICDMETKFTIFSWDDMDFSYETETIKII